MTTFAQMGSVVDDSSDYPRPVERSKHASGRRLSRAGESEVSATTQDNTHDLNRWSRSTNSSAGSGKKSRRNRSGSGTTRTSLGENRMSSPRQQPKRPHFVDYSPKDIPRRDGARPNPEMSPPSHQSSYPTSPLRQGRATRASAHSGSLTALPSLTAPPALTDPNDVESPSTIQTLPTPLTQMYGQQDYFGSESDDFASTRNKYNRPGFSRNPTAPVGSLATVGSTSATPNTYNNASNHQNKRPNPNASAAAESHQAPHKTGENQNGHRRSRTRSRSEKDKKAMLSKALQKANTAVLLDNAQNIEGALEAYNSACDLLLQVTYRTTGVEDKRKLDAIRLTYDNRIDELQLLLASQPPNVEEKTLPTRPLHEDSPGHDAYNSDTTRITAADAPVAHASSDEEVPIINIGSAAPRLSYPPAGRDSFFSRTMAAVEGSAGGVYDDIENDSNPDVFEASEASVLKPDKSNPVRLARTESSASLTAEEQLHPGMAQQNLRGIPQSDLGPHVPRSLSPRRQPSAQKQGAAGETWKQDYVQPLGKSHAGQGSSLGQHNQSNVSLSWLDTIDESGSSRSSSVHSVSSQLELRRKHIRALSGETDPDFDAAFDAAVEAAYNEGLEPDMEARRKRMTAYRHSLHPESVTVPSAEVKELFANDENDVPPAFPQSTDSDEEEERVLEALAQDYGQSFNFDLQSKSALPRQSSSSDHSRSTWQSSQASDRVTAATPLTTVTEDESSGIRSPPKRVASGSNDASLSPLRSRVSGVASPPIPLLPTQNPPSRPDSAGKPTMSGVRGRRMPGQNNAQILKIETSTKRDVPSGMPPLNPAVDSFPEEEEMEASERAGLKSEESRLGIEGESGSNLMPDELKPGMIPTLRTTINDSYDVGTDAEPGQANRPVTSAGVLDHHPTTDGGFLTSDAANRPTLFRKTKSSLSLRSHQEHTLLLASPADFDSNHSAITPMSSTFMSFATAKRNQNPLTSQRANLPALGQTLSEQQFPGGIYLFDTTISSSRHLSARSPNPLTPQPNPLESCPESTLLRPFWLMRTLGQTLTHPRGGFLTNRLFVPREIWQTRGVKLRFIEDKISSCDMLTAALQKLSNVDTYDVEAVEKELQSFEETMERTQAFLSKKLGNDVGTNGATNLFRDAPAFIPAHGNSNSTPNSTANPTNPSPADLTISAGSSSHDKSTKSNSGGKGGYLSSWRKLRNKSSGTPLFSDGSSSNHHPPGSSAGGVTGHGPHPRLSDRHNPGEVMTMPSVPMTVHVPVERRGGKRDPKVWAFDGPNRDYMNSLARLFDGVQVLDLIARQVEDPGLRHSSPTHVGLELSIRHAAEFFSFYICRFALADLGLLIDKFVKKGSEWVMT